MTRQQGNSATVGDGSRLVLAGLLAWLALSDLHSCLCGQEGTGGEGSAEWTGTHAADTAERTENMQRRDVPRRGRREPYG